MTGLERDIATRKTVEEVVAHRNKAMELLQKALSLFVAAYKEYAQAASNSRGCRETGIYPSS